MGAGSGLVLVHGGEHGAWCWDPILPHLAHPALALDLPGRGSRPADVARLRVRDLIASAAADLDASGLGAAVVVAHSMGGLTGAALAAARPEVVRHLVMVAAVAPRPGRAVVDEFPFPLGAWLRRRFERQAARGEARFLLPTWMARRRFCSDMTPAQTRFVMARRCVDTPHMLLEPSDRSGLPGGLPRTYVLLLDDRNMPLRVQRTMAGNLGGCDLVALAAGHDAMVSRPAELARILNRVAADALGAAAP